MHQTDTLLPFVGALVRRAFRAGLAALLAVVPAAAAAGPSAGQPIAAAPADKAVSQALREVSAEHIRQTITTLVNFRNRNTLSSMDKDLPTNTGATAAAQWIEEQFRGLAKDCKDCMEVKTDTFTEPADSGPRSRIHVPTTITNVYAVLKGSDPAQATRMYLVTGHYDTRNTDTNDTHGFAPGANDDSSGVAVSLECARVLSRHRFPATIVFAAVAGEEQGLNGSKHLATMAKQQGWHLEGVLNNDIVGGDTTPGETLQDKDRVRVFSQGVSSTAIPEELRRTLSLGLESDSPSRELARTISLVSRSYFPARKAAPARDDASFHPVLIFRADRYLRGGDHTSFNQQGFAAVRFTEWRENFDHQHQNVRTENGKEYGDLLKFVDFQYVANVARLNAATLATLASAPAAPEEVRVVTAELDNNSTLKWKPGAGTPADAAYDVVWRDTEAGEWQIHQAVSAAEAARGAVTLPVSKDNVIFGVRACNAAGQCSPAVAPIPER